MLPAVLLLCILGLLLPLPLGSAAESAPEAGFTLLFNGKNLDGWKTAKGKTPESLDGKTEAFNGRFKVVDGCISYDPAIKGDLYIETSKGFGKDVHIKFEFNPGPKCNNDVFLRGTKFDIKLGSNETKNVKEGEWHTMEIIVQGDKVEHKINGEIARASKAGAAATPFMLRAEFGAIQIRNIRVKE